MSTAVFDRLHRLLDDAGATFEVLEHEPVYTSEQAAQVRGTTLASGAKALICKAAGDMRMFVLPANLRLCSKSVRKSLGFRSLRFATRDEVQKITGLEPGSIPPFGKLFELPTYCDQRLAEQPRINFNAGDHAKSINLNFDDFLRVQEPVLGYLARPTEDGS